MFILQALKNSLEVRAWETLTSGSVNKNRVRFQFSADWDGLIRTAVFTAGETSRSILLADDNMCAIPWEVLAAPDLRLLAGVYGVGGSGEIILSTVWADLGKIYPGAAPGDPALPPTPDLWQQTVAGKADRLGVTPDGALGLYAGDKLLSVVSLPDGGVTDHRLLEHREEPGQHPIAAISGLEDKLDAIPTAMTAAQLRKILMS